MDDDVSMDVEISFLLQSGYSLAFADIRKAYDNVDLEILNRIMYELVEDQEVLDEWEQEYQDLLQLNMAVDNNHLIKRTNGLPQGSELAPGLFNIYTSFLLSKLPKSEYIDYLIFADNWVVYSKYDIDLKNYVENVINPILIKEGGLQFELDEAVYHRSRVDAKTETKFLGIDLILDKNIDVNIESAKFNLDPIKPQPGYFVIAYAKRFLIPKFRYYYTIICIINQKLGEKYLEWFKAKLRLWLRKTIITVKISNSFLKAIMMPKDANEVDKKFYSPYIADEHFRKNCNEYHEQKEMMKRLSELAEFVIQNELKIGIYQLTNALFSNYKPAWIFRNNPKWQSKHQLNRSLQILDMIYYCLVSRKKMSTFIAREQEMFNFRTLRRKCFRFL